MQTNSLTAVILAKNVEKTISTCLLSLNWVENIIVIDDSSEDNTKKIAEKFGAKVYQRILDTFCAQRNFALGKVTTEWVLFIDTDEEVPPALATEIQKVITTPDYNGYRFPRKNIIFGKWIQHTGWYPDYQLHLFKTTKGHYVREVDEQVEISGPIGELKEALIHHNYDSIAHYLLKRPLYTQLEARKKIKEGYGFQWADLINKPLNEFLRRFFAEKGYLDGTHGLILSLLQSYSVLLTYLNIWEIQGSQSEELINFPQELDKAGHDLYYWLEKNTPSKFNKLRYRIKQKL